MVGLASEVYRELATSIVLINTVAMQLHYTTTSRVAPEEKPRILVRRTQETEPACSRHRRNRRRRDLRLVPKFIS